MGANPPEVQRPAQITEVCTALVFETMFFCFFDPVCCTERSLECVMSMRTPIEYEQLKAIFEKNICGIFFHNIEHFVCKASGTVSDSEVFDRKELIRRCAFLKYVEGNERFEFLERWLNDENRRVVLDITCEPTLYSSLSFNLWDPFRGSKAICLNNSRELVNSILEYMKELFGEKGRDKILDFFAYTIKEPDMRLKYALAIVGGFWYERTAIVHFFSNAIIGPYLARRLVSPTTDAYAGLKLIWLDSHYSKGHNDILFKEVIQAGSNPVWGLRNIANIIVTCEEFTPSEDLLVVHAVNTILPSRFTSVLRDEGSSRAFHDYLLYEH